MFLISQDLRAYWSEDGSDSRLYGPYPNREECDKAVKSLEADWLCPETNGYWCFCTICISEIVQDTPTGGIEWQKVSNFSREND
jgi:hypothetical protein